MKIAINGIETECSPVVVSTAHRGVFFGYLPEGANPADRSLLLFRCRMCVYWSADVKGFNGLAVTGPLKNCRVGPAAGQALLHDVTAVIPASTQAERAWEAEPWA